MIIVQDTQADVAYAISGVTALDAKGQPVAADQLVYVVESTDPKVVAVKEDTTDDTKGTVKFGNEGTATVNVKIEAKNGTLLGSFAQSFTVTSGPPSAIVGGSIVFDGLTDAAEVAPVPGVGPPAVLPDGSTLNPVTHLPDGTLRPM